MCPDVEKGIHRLGQQSNHHATNTPPVAYVGPVLRHIDVPPDEDQKRRYAPQISRDPVPWLAWA